MGFGMLTRRQLRSSAFVGLSVCLSLLLLSFVNAQTSQVLTPSYPSTISVAANTPSYFKVPILSSYYQDLTIDVTPIGTGNPDIFASLVTEFPNANTAGVYRSNRTSGEDGITIPHTAYSSSSTCFITVAESGGSGNVSFSIVADFISTVWISNGYPQVGSVHSASVQYYRTYVYKTVGVSLNVITTNMIGSTITLVSTNSAVMPTLSDPSTYQFTTENSATGNFLSVPYEQWPSDNSFYIAVVAGGNWAAQFSIVAVASNTAVVLRDGLAIQGVVFTGNYSYYMFPLYQTGCTSLSVSVTPFTGNVDLVGSTSISQPTNVPGHYDKYSNSSLGTNTISWTGTISQSTYYFGVLAPVRRLQQNIQYSIVLYTSCSAATINPITLSLGYPQQSWLQQNHYLYYKVIMNDVDQDITISLTRYYGDPDMFIRNDGQTPSTTSWQWESTYLGSDVITIHPSDLQSCKTRGFSPCVYLIAVRADSDTSYSIVATSTTIVTQLQDSVSVVDYLLAGQNKFYTFAFDGAASRQRTITMAVTDLGRGNPDLYVSIINPRPTPGNYTWGGQHDGSDAISIAPGTPGYPTGPVLFHIGVYATTTTYFSLSASTSATTRLTNGLPQSGTVAQDAFALYYIDVSPGYGSLTVTLANRWGLASLYITSTGRPPNTQTYDAYVAGWLSTKTYTFQETAANACVMNNPSGGSPTCRYIIGAHGDSRTVTFTVTASTADANIYLANGVSQRQSLVANQWKYFFCTVDDVGLDLSIMVTPLSGNPDIYVSNHTQKPNAASWDWRSVNNGADAIDIILATPTTYYIGVLATTNTTFTILAVATPEHGATADDVINVYDGEPQSGYIIRNHYNYYRFDVTSDIRWFTISVSATFGDPDIYTKLQPNNSITALPTTTYFDQRALVGGSDTLTVFPATIPADKIATYVIGVFGYSSSLYTITIASQHAITTLVSGQQIYGNSSPFTYRYYSLFVDHARDVSFTLTPFSGDPDLYVSVIYPNPTMAQGRYTWSSTSWWEDGLTISTVDPNYCNNCYYYVGVYCGSTACGYSIMGTASDTVSLHDRMPVLGAVGTYQFRYYTYIPNTDTTKIVVTVTPLSGWPMIYGAVGRKPTFEDYDYVAATFMTTTPMTILKDGDPKFCAQPFNASCTFYFGVYGIENSTYTISAVANDGFLYLVSGVPVSATLQQGQYAHYEFLIPGSGLDTAFTLTPYNGDPDLYLSYSDFPNSTFFDMASLRAGSDTLFVKQGNVSIYYLSVYAYVDTSYTLLAVNYNDSDASSVAPIALVVGQPQNALVLANGYRYFTFVLTSFHTQLVFSVARKFGDPDIYVNGPLNSAFPTSASADWYSNAYGPDTLKIAAPGLGIYRISIYGFEAADFTITAATNDAGVILQNGVAYQGQLTQSNYQYFIFGVSSNDHDLTFTLTAFNGDPDLYVLQPSPECRGTSYSSTACQNQLQYDRANSSRYDYAALLYLADAISIPRTNVYQGYYHISVYAYQNCSYSLMANYGNNTWLQDGVPQQGVVAIEQSVWYQFMAAAAHTNVSFTLTAFTGHVYMYISATQFPIHNDPTSYTWSNTAWSGTQTITIPAGTNLNCQTGSQCTYTILLYGYAAARYSLTAATQFATVALVSGVPLHSDLPTGSWDYYYSSVPTQTSLLLVSLTVLSGTVDLYGSTSTHLPSASSNMWASTWNGQPIHVDSTDRNFKVGTYYFGVYAHSQSSYTITATIIDVSQISNSSSIYLVNGIPQMGYQPIADRMQIYSFELNFMGADTNFGVSIFVSPLYGDPDLYVTNDTSTPTTSHYGWRSLNSGRDTILIPKSCKRCTYKIGVWSYSPTVYSLTVSTTEVMTELSSGFGVRDVVLQGRYKYYQFTVNQWGSRSLVFSLTTAAGDADLFIAKPSSGILFPNATNSDFQETWPGSDVFSIAYPNVDQGTWYLGVYGYQESTYTITATLGAVILVPGEPHQDIVGSDSSRLYAVSFFPSSPTTPLVFTVDLASNGFVELYVCAATAKWNQCNNYYPAPNTATTVNNQFNTSSEGTASASITITFPSPVSNTCQNCTYYLAVKGIYHSVYYVTASYGNLATLLPVGRSITGSVNSGQYVYYRAVVDSVDEDVNFDVTEYLGDVVLVLSADTRYPTTEPGHYTIKDDSPGTHGAHIQMRANSADLKVAMYYIGIYGKEDSRYAITFTNNLRLLVPGVPQLAQASPSGTFFFVNVDQTYNKSDIIISINPGSNAGGVDSDTFDIFVTNNASLSTTPDSEAKSQWHNSMMVGNSFTLRRADLQVAACDICTYYIGLKCSSCGWQWSQPFTVTISLDNQVGQLLANSWAYGIATPTQYNFYQIYVKDASNMTVFVEPCSGNSVVYASATDRMPTAASPNRWYSEPSEGVTKLSQNTGLSGYNSIYLGVNSVEAAPSSSYRIYTVISATAPPSPTVTNSVLRLTGGDGTIKVRFLAATPFLGDGKLRYSVYVYKQLAAGVKPPNNMFTSCGLKSIPEGPVNKDPITSVLADAQTKELEYTIGGLSNGNSYYVNVLVEQLDSKDYVVGPFASVYRYTDFVLESSGSSESFADSAMAKVLLGIGIPVLVIILVAVLYLVVKNRRLTQELTGVEMQDMPKHKVIKAMRGPRGGATDEENKPNKSGKAYDRLIATDEPVSDEYLPPQSTASATDDDSLVEQI